MVLLSMNLMTLYLINMVEKNEYNLRSNNWIDQPNFYEPFYAWFENYNYKLNYISMCSKLYYHDE